MNRREVITLLGGAAAWPFAARAQQPGIPVVGFLNPTSPGVITDRVRGFRQGLKDTAMSKAKTLQRVNCCFAYELSKRLETPGGAAAPLSLQWSQKNVALSLDSAEAQSGPRVVGPPFSLSSPTSCGYIPYGTRYAAPCGIYSSSYAIAYERAAATAAPYGYSYAAPYSYYGFST